MTSCSGFTRPAAISSVNSEEIIELARRRIGFDLLLPFVEIAALIHRRATSRVLLARSVTELLPAQRFFLPSRSRDYCELRDEEQQVRVSCRPDGAGRERRVDLNARFPVTLLFGGFDFQDFGADFLRAGFQQHGHGGFDVGRIIPALRYLGADAELHRDGIADAVANVGADDAHLVVADGVIGGGCAFLRLISLKNAETKED